MANWALVIGIDEYWTQRACLKGAVNDALAIRRWLVADGGVKPRNLKLLLTPRADRKPRIAHEPATRKNILDAVETLVEVGMGERLYFFFAGHGLTAHVANRAESMIAAADFSLQKSDNAIALRSIWELFETTQFADQFFFVDACRDAPAEAVGELKIGDWPVARVRRPGQGPVQQFILYATSPGLRAKELEQEGGRARGAFTSTLLLGLRGGRRAKVWSPARRVYEVRWERLVENVRTEFEHRQLGAILGEDGLPLYQIPQDAGSRGVAGRDRDPVLAWIQSKDVPKERLDIELDPSGVVNTAQIQVLNESGEVVRRWPIRKRRKLSFTLLPRTYGLRAWAPEYRTKFERPPVDLYGELDGKAKLASLKLDPGEGEPLSEDVTTGQGSLTVRCDDPLTAIEVLDSTGEVIAVAYGRLHLPVLRTGFYRARLRLPKGTSAETLVELLPSEAEEITLVADSPPAEVRKLVTALGGEMNQQKLVAVSDAVGPMASAHASTILALAGARSLGGAGGHDAVARLGFAAVGDGVRDPTEALVVLVGADSPKRLAGIRVRRWGFGEPVAAGTTRLVPSDAAPYVGRAVLRAPAGPHWLSLEPKGGAAMVFALASLPGQATVIVAQAERTRFRLYQYLPRVDGDPGARERQLRRLELAQRLVLGSGIAAAGLLARDFVHAATLDPLGATLGAYVLLRLGLAGELDEATKRLADEFGELSDVHVVRGETVAATEGPEAAAEHFVRAAEAGVPIFGEGLTRLLEAAKEFQLRHDHVDAARTVFEGHMSGSMWSVWLPGELEPGSPLVPLGPRR